MLNPAFMQHFDVFDAERKCVATASEVKTFCRKWFPVNNWPHWRKPDEWAEISNQARRNQLVAEAATGRTWAPLMISYALEPEARYEYCRTTAMFDGIVFPHPRSERRTLGSSAWHLDCYFCLIGTWSEGGIACPLCKRQMVYSWLGD